MMAHPDASDDNLINIIREDFSDAPTMNEAWEELLHMHQKPEEQMRVYMFTGMGTCTRGRQALGQLKRHTNM